MKRIIKKFNLNYTVNINNEIITGNITMYSFNKLFAVTKLTHTLKRTHGKNSEIKIN